MAKKPSRKKTMSGKYFPVQTKIPLVYANTADSNNMIVRGDRHLSQVNHRLMRQSRVYNLKVDIDPDLEAGRTIEVWALAPTWMAMKAYQFAYSQWKESNKEELAQIGNAKARWQDFRVYDGINDSADNYSTVFGFRDGFGVGVNESDISSGEYTLSEVHDVSGNTFTLRWIGSASGHFNIIDEYDRTADTDASPTSALTGGVAYDGLSDELDAAALEELSNGGNAPPYARTTLENQVWVKVATLQAAPAAAHGATKLSSGYFDAPCGLVVLRSSTFWPKQAVADALGSEVSITFKGGDYKGVHAPSMLE